MLCSSKSLKGSHKITATNKHTTMETEMQSKFLRPSLTLHVRGGESELLLIKVTEKTPETKSLANMFLFKPSDPASFLLPLPSWLKNEQ